MKTALEIERKFLLKQVPYKLPTYILGIQQFYCSTKEEPDFRIRKSTNIGTGKTTYTKTIKVRKAPGVYEETEGKLTEAVFNENKKHATTCINKKRVVYKFGKLKWEIDIYDFKLAIAEIELPTMNYPLKLPKFITDVLIMEVTKFKQFTNKALSEPYNYKL